MPLYVVVGSPGCHLFTHACIVLEYLKRSLPDFDYKRIEKFGESFKDFVDDIYDENGWNGQKFYEPPIIWKELCIYTERKRYLIGALTEFFDYCSDYYGLQPIIPREDLLKLTQESLNVYKMMRIKASQVHKKVVAIKGTRNPQKMLDFITNELPQALNLNPEDVQIRILDESYELLRICYEDMFLTHSYEELLEGADILIVLDDFSHPPGKTTMKWLRKCVLGFFLLAEYINLYADRNLKIILCHPGSTCFTATVLATYCTNISASNIVAITADEGLRALNNLSQSTRVGVENMGAPVVWGWPQIIDYIDVKNIVVKTKCTEVNKKVALFGNVTLLFGKVQDELRLSKYLINDKIEREVRSKKYATAKALNREPTLGKIRALMSLLKLWFGNGTSEDSIISLGVCCNGSFGLPVGSIIVSQPAYLNDRKEWQPFTPYCLTKETRYKITGLVPAMRRILCNLQLPNTLCMCENCRFA